MSLSVYSQFLSLTDPLVFRPSFRKWERDIIIPEHSKFVIKGIAHVRNTCNNTSAVFMLEGNFDIPEELSIKESLVRCGNGSSPKIHVVVQNASAHDVILPKNVNMGMLQNVKGVFGIPDKDTYTQDISKDDNNEQLWDPPIEIVQIKCFIHIVTGDETNYLYLGTSVLHGLIIDTSLNKVAKCYLLSIEILYFNVRIDRIDKSTKLNYLLNNHFNDKY